MVDVETAESGFDPPAFHDLLKAKAMPYRVPLQLIRASTYDPARAGRQKRKTWKLRQRQDSASVAWNFFTALYYKAGGTPWRMVRSPAQLDACYVGVAFYRTVDGQGTATSVAQVYNQRGDGVVVREAARRDGRTNTAELHLSQQDAHNVFKDALTAIPPRASAPPGADNRPQDFPIRRARARRHAERRRRTRRRLLRARMGHDSHDPALPKWLPPAAPRNLPSAR